MFKVLDLFAGAGGLSYGFKMTGDFQFVAAAEINKDAQKTYIENVVEDPAHFEMIDNVVGFDFNALNNRVGGIDVVIGGPPCQGFSNANRQKNKLISMNNSLVKEYFRAIKEIRPQAFVMENVSMLKSDTHRFYESTWDKVEVDQLSIPKKLDTLILTKEEFEGIDLEKPLELLTAGLILPSELCHLLVVLNKNLHNELRLPNFMLKNGSVIVEQIEKFIIQDCEFDTKEHGNLCNKLIQIKDAVDTENVESAEQEIKYVVNLQKLLESIQEIEDNGLIGKYEYNAKTGLVFSVNSYSVIDYIEAILGTDYMQKGETVNAEWFGVPQERKRYIIIGIRNDIYEKSEAELRFPTRGKTITNTVSDAIRDLVDYEAGYEIDYPVIKYKKHGELSRFARMMRRGSKGVANHITTKTGQVAMDRFKKITQGENFHSLDISEKTTYSKPERTQNTIYLRLDPNLPSKTVVNVRKSMWIHPTLDRAITIREAARLQSFPDKFVFFGSKDSQYQQVGNAVPPLLAKKIAAVVLKYLQ